VVDPLASVYAAWTDHVSDATTPDLERPSLAEAWTVKELLLHQLLDARRALVALASTVDAAPDVDRVSYWRSFHPEEGDGGVAHARFVVASAAAYQHRQLLAEWRETSAAVVASLAGGPHDVVATQGKLIRRDDLRSTLVVEATVHLLDAHGTPPPEAIAATIHVLEALRGGPLPRRDATEVLRATGRLPSRTAGYPLLG
jgi:hypothetical protein